MEHVPESYIFKYLAISIKLQHRSWKENILNIQYPPIQKYFLHFNSQSDYQINSLHDPLTPIV